MKTAIFIRNLSTIEERWPEISKQLSEVDIRKSDITFEANTLIINNIQLTSNYDRLSEAALQLDLIPEDSSQAYIYGPGLGDCTELILKRAALQRLHVIILNKTVFLHALSVRNHNAWLKDKRTSLHLTDSLNDVIWPFCVNPAELVLAEDSSAQLRDRLELELNHNYIQKRHTEPNSQVQQQIRQNLDFVAQDSDISQLNLDIPNTVFIAAAGPTLESHLPYLAKKKPFIVAVDAAVKTLVAHNILPNIIVSIDPHVNQLFSGLSFKTFKDVPLVYFPSIERTILEQWIGKRYCSYSNTGMYLNFPRSHIKTTLFSAGSVIHPAIDLAVFLKAKKVILLGADFSFTHNKSHANAEKSANSAIILDRARHWVINSYGHKVPTLPNFKGYLRDLERYIKQNQQIDFFNGSPLGAVIEGTQLWNP